MTESYYREIAQGVAKINKEGLSATDLSVFCIVYHGDQYEIFVTNPKLDNTGTAKKLADDLKKQYPEFASQITGDSDFIEGIINGPVVRVPDTVASRLAEQGRHK